MSVRNTVLVAAGAWFHECPGGSHKVATELAEDLAQRGHRVFYVAGSPLLRPPAVVTHRGVEVWRYANPSVPSPSPRNLVLHVSRTAALVRRILRRAPVDFINGHEVLQFLGALTGAQGHSVVTSLCVHSPQVAEFLANRDAPRAGDVKLAAAVALLAALERAALRGAHRVATMSAYTLTELERRYPGLLAGKAQVLPPWVEYARFADAPAAAAARDLLGGPWHSPVPVLFTVRRLVRRTGVDRLVDMAALLRDQGTEVRLVIAGDGPLRPALEQRVRDLQLTDRVRFLGRVPEDCLPLLYRAADCFVLPSAELECFGLTILESFAAGVPVVATPVGAIPETLGAVGRGGLAQDASAPALARQVQEWLSGRFRPQASALQAWAASYGRDARAAAMARFLFSRPGAGAAPGGTAP